MAESDFSVEQRAELAKLVASIRSVIATSASLTAPADALRALTAQADALAASLAPYAGTKPVPRFTRDVTNFLPFSPVTGVYNALAPHVAITTDGETDKRVTAVVRFSNVYEGPPRHVHGGHIASMFDQLLAFANRANGVGGMTASLTIRYRKPTPLNVDLKFVARTVRVDDKKIYAEGQCFVGDEIVSDAEGLFVRLDPERARRLFTDPE